MINYFLEALNNHIDTIREYLRYGNVNITDQNGKSLLHYAARGGSLEVAKLLLDNYINPNLLDNNNESALFEAVMRGEIGLTKLLIRNKADINILNRNGESLFCKAVLTGNRVMLDLLSDTENIDYSLLNHNDENVLFYCLKARNNELFKKIANKELLQQHDYHHRSLLMAAIMYQNDEIFTFLYHDSVNLYEHDNENMNLIYYAAKYGNSYVTSCILKRKPIIDGNDKNGKTILQYAFENPNNVYSLFDNYAISYDYLSYKRNYPYHIAVIARNYDLLEYGKPNIKKEDNNGVSLLELSNLIKDEIINKLFNK